MPAKLYLHFVALDITPPELLTERGAQDELVKQFSVFMENKVGRLLDIVKMLTQANVHVVALSILDTSDAAIVRIVVDDPEAARQLFLEHALAFTELRLLVVELTHSTEDLQPVLTALLQAECNVHSCYSLLTRPRGKAALALHVEDTDVASSVLISSGFKLLTQRDISR